MSLSASAVSSIAGITDVITSLVTVSSSNSQSPRASNTASSSVADSIAESSELVASSSPTPTLLASSVVASSESPSSTPSPAAASSAPAAASSPENSAAITVVVTSVATLTELPLTTIYTPPASCSTRPFTLATANNNTIGIWDAQYNSTYACYPPSWNTAKVNYYLPGVCPEGYNYVGIFSYQITTSANCCPSGMSLVDNNNCQTVISTPTYALMPDLTNTFAISDGFTGLATPINVAWQSADLQSFTPAAAPVLAVASAWNLPTSTRTADTETSSAILSSGGLSTGAKAGIGVGVAAAVLILLGVLLFFFLRKRKQRAIKTLPDEPEMSGKAELGSTISSSSASSPTTAVSSPSTAQAHEIDPGSEVIEIQGNHINEAHGTNLVEMPVERPCPELAGSVKPHELEAPWQFRVHELP